MIRLFEPMREPQPIAQEQPALHAIDPASDASAAFEMVSELGETPVEEVEIKGFHQAIVLSDPRSPGADRFRYLRMRLRELKAKGPLKSLVITSPMPRDGKSTVAMNLATVLSEHGKQKVLLIEADLHRPTLAKSLGIPVRPGLAECLESGLDPMLALTRLEPLCWYLLQAGEPKGHPTEILQSGAFVQLMETLSPLFDWILIDTPPVAPLTDALYLARIADASLLVLRAGCTPQESADEALSLLGPGRVAGIIFNGAEGLNRLYSKYSGYYGKK